MTEIQSMTLSICFGAVVGAVIGDLVIIIKFAIAEHKEKKRKRKENEDKQ